MATLENGKKWVVEGKTGVADISIDASTDQVLYFGQCKDSMVTVKGKINCISIVGCKKSAVVFDSCIGMVEVINCQGLQLQCTGSVPSYSIDGSSGVTVFFNKDNINAEVFTSKSTEVNLLTPGKTEEDELTEFCIPHQFNTKFVDGKWVTEPVVHVAGG